MPIQKPATEKAGESNLTLFSKSVTLKSRKVMEWPSGEELGFTIKFLGVWMDETLSLGFEILLPDALCNFAILLDK